MDFNKVFEQMFSQGGENKDFNPMQYVEALGGLQNSFGGSGLLFLIILLLLCCGCGNFGFGNYGGSGQCNNQCFELCCRRKKHHCKKYKKYECYLDPCSCNNCCCNNCGGYSGCGYGYGGCSWIWVIVLIAILFIFKGKGHKGNDKGYASNIINVDTAE